MATMTLPATMKAVRINSFGGPEVLKYEDCALPELQADELLVRIHTAGVNPVDWKIREGRLGRIALPSVMGSDFSGVIEQVGSGVHAFRTGDAVYGSVADESGSYAEYATSTESQLARKPEGMDDITAAALPIASMTAWQALFDQAKLQPGQKILIHAAAGGVGSFAVQFAKWKKAFVIGTASAKNADYVRKLGADQVIDYHAQKFEDVLRDLDVVFDTIGGDTQERSFKVLKKWGMLVSIVQPPVQEKANAHGVKALFFRCDHHRGDQLAQIGEMVASGQIKVKIDNVLPLSEARKAQELSKSGHVNGKIVLKVD